MKLANIELGKLSVSALNMRHGKKAPDVSDILPTIRARGVLVPLLVRATEDDMFEIVAGRRRYFAASIVADEQRASGGDIEPVPCAIMQAGDDAAALEASFIENIARLDPDEVSQWETFTRMVKEGRTAEQIGQTFGLTDLYVSRVLALGNLHPRIRDLYRREEIDTRTVRHLRLASKAQQKEWLRLLDSEDSHAPTGTQLKAWLFGGAEISTKVALFPLESYGGKIIADLFEKHGYFADAAQFWQAQNEAIAARIDAYKADGWADVEVLESGHHFYGHEYEKTPKAKGGKVFVTVKRNGEVEFFEGWLTGKEARKARAAAAKTDKTDADRKAAEAGRSETTSALQRYIDLHRHAATRAVLTDYPAVALRLMLAHAIAGSSLWTVKAADQRAADTGTTDSLQTSIAETLFGAKRQAALTLLGLAPDRPGLVGGEAKAHGTGAIFARLLVLDDAAVLAILCVVMGETLAIESAVAELLGDYLKPDMAALWQADDAFFDLIRDRKVTNAMLREVAGKKVADANLTEKVKTQKTIIRDCLTGANNRKKVDGWVPKWLTFPPAAYVGRPFETLARFKDIAGLAKGLPAPLAPPPATAAPSNSSSDPASRPADAEAPPIPETAPETAPDAVIAEPDLAVAAE